ncbi:MAG: hypothetical protein GF364_17010 [Candidatus Lokiarchaeota archaeon]|nr:hypothetical protein [Candidatus Lokiarchaeota archaeon]
MSSEISTEIRKNLQTELAKIETESDLNNMTILSRSGMKIATASSSELDADPITASSAALIDLGIRFNNNIEHGDLREILIRAPQGYAILMYIDSEYMTFAGLPNPSRIGYYLGLLRIKCRYFSYVLAGGMVTDEIKQEIEAQKEKETKEEDEDLVSLFETDASGEEDMGAMKDVLDFLDDWGGDDAKPVADGQVDIGIDEEFMIGEQIEGTEIGLPDSAAKTIKKSESDDEFPIYDDEVPPIPLDDVEALVIGEQEEIADQEGADYAEEEVVAAGEDGLNFDDMPDFDAMSASEYDDDDWDLSEDEAMLEALDDLGYIDEDKKKKQE